MRKKTYLFSVFFVLIALFFSFQANADTLFESDAQKCEIYNLINEGVLNGEQEIDVVKYKISINDADAFINTYIWENPEYSFCIVERNYKHVNDKIVSINFTYDNPSTIRSRHESINNQLNAIVSRIEPSLTTIEQLAWINDYICDTFQYDVVTEYHTIDKLLETEKGICEAYANLFTALCKKININASYCYSNEIQHIWNLVEVDGAWYHIDTTWNDSYAERYEFFLLSDDAAKKAIAENQTETFFMNSLHRANSTKYDNAFWRDSIYSSMENIDGDTYVIKDWKLYIVTWHNLGIRQVATLNDEKWAAPGSSGSYYSSCFSDLEKVGSCLYYTTPCGIRSYNVTTKEDKSIYSDTNCKQIVSIRAIEGGFEIRYNNDFNNDITNKKSIKHNKVFTVKYLVGNEVACIQFYSPNDSIILPVKLYTTNLNVSEWSYKNGDKVTSNLNVAATIAPGTSQVLILFKIDNEVFKQYIISIGDKIPFPGNPTKDSDNINHYIFIEWLGYKNDMTAYENEYTFYASFSEIKRSYSISFYKDGTLIEQSMVDAGSTIVFPDVEQTISKNGKQYKFVGWDTDEKTVLSSMAINAVYAEIGKQCTITYYVDGTLFYTEKVTAGSTLKYPNVQPVKQSTSTSFYIFNGWTGPKEGTYVVDDVSLTAEFKVEQLPVDSTTKPNNDNEKSFFDNFDIKIGPIAVVVIVIAIVILAWYLLFKRGN